MHVFGLASISADGYIAPTALERSTNWTSREDLRFFIDRTRQAGVIVMGATTFATLPTQPQPKKINIVYTRGGMEKPTEARDIAGKNYQLQILDEQTTGPLDPSIVYVTQLSPASLVDSLDKMGYPELAVCGGASIYDLFLRSGVVSTLYLTVEPVIFGEGVRLLQTKLSLQMILVKNTSLSDQTILLEYSLMSSAS